MHVFDVNVKKIGLILSLFSVKRLILLGDLLENPGDFSNFQGIFKTRKLFTPLERRCTRHFDPK